MKFVSGAGGGEFSGSIGSMTASRNRYGSYYRNKVVPVNPNTTRQQNVRSNFTSMVNAWTNTLTAAQRTSWDTYATNVLNPDGFALTGQNWYIANNLPRLLIGSARVDDAPIVFNRGNPVDSIELIADATKDVIGINLAATGLAITANVVGAASDDGDILLYLGAPVNVTNKFFKGPYQLAASIAIADAALSADFTDLYTVLTSDNGDPVAGQNRGVRLRVAYDDGRLSDSYSLLAVVTADSA